MMWQAVRVKQINIQKVRKRIENLECFGSLKLSVVCYSQYKIEVHLMTSIRVVHFVGIKWYLILIVVTLVGGWNAGAIRWVTSCSLKETQYNMKSHNSMLYLTFELHWFAELIFPLVLRKFNCYRALLLVF